MIYSAYVPPRPMPRWLRPLNWWVDVNTRLVHLVANVVVSSEMVVVDVALLYWRNFHAVCLAGWTVASLVLTNWMLKVIAAADVFHFSLGLWHDNPLRRPAFHAVALAEALIDGESRGRKYTRRRTAVVVLITLLSLVLLVVASPYWLLRKPFRDSTDPNKRTLETAWRIITVGLAYLFFYGALVLTLIRALD